MLTKLEQRLALENAHVAAEDAEYLLRQEESLRRGSEAAPAAKVKRRPSVFGEEAEKRTKQCPHTPWLSAETTRLGS